MIKKMFVLLMALAVFCTGCESGGEEHMVNDQPEPVSVTGDWSVEGEIESFMTEPSLEIQQLFEGERFPNVVVTTKGTLLATWGGAAKNEEEGSFIVRRSEDGGKTWQQAITVSKPGFHGGGVTVNETTGDILVFVEEGHPPATFEIYKSTDDGKTWDLQDFVIHPDKRGNIPSMHMNEAGITLSHGRYAGRLIRPTRYYAGANKRSEWPNHYTNAIYSDNGGKTWHTSDPFPAFGTGEAALAELSDGTIYYNSRRHYSDDGLNPRMRHIAWSEDGGESWEDLSVSEILPDGRQDRDYGLMGGLTRLPVKGRDILLFSNILKLTDFRPRGVFPSGG